MHAKFGFWRLAEVPAAMATPPTNTRHKVVLV